MPNDDTPDLSQHDRRMHYRCPMLGGEVPFGHCRTTAEGHPCARIVTCWERLFDVRAFLAAHYDLAELETRWAEPRQPKILTLVELVRQARAETGPDADSP